MRILFITQYGWKYGGGEIYTANLRTELEKRKHVVKIISSNNGQDKGHFSDFEFAEFRNPWLKAVARIFNYRSYLAVRQAIAQTNPDIIHIQSIDEEVSASVLLAGRTRPIIMTLHSTSTFAPRKSQINVPNVTIKRRVRNQIVERYLLIRHMAIRQLMKKAHTFIAPSKFMERQAHREGLTRVVTLHNGIPRPRERPPNDSKSIVYVGRLSEEKGVIYLLKALALVIKEVPDASLTIIGDGPLRKELETRSAQLGIHSHVEFLGSRPSKEVLRHYSKCSLIAIPSIRTPALTENLPTVCIEALSTGRPVVASRVGGLPEMVDDGVTGYLVKEKNPRELARRIVTLLTNHQLRRKMSAAARKQSEKFDIKKHARDIEKLYVGVKQVNLRKSEEEPIK